MTLAAEVRSLNRGLARMRWGDPDAYAASVPLRLHQRELDGGGGPDLAPQFIAWLADAGVCMCEPRESDGYMVMRHYCDRKVLERGPKFRIGAPRMHARRLNRALRQLRLIAPAEYDALFLVFARGYTATQAQEKINGGRLERGQDPYTDDDFAILLVAGAGKLTAAW